MKVSFLMVVACINFGGSYYDQTSLSTVLSAFEARLTLPRSKAAGLSANESAPDPTALTTSAPVSTALATSAATEVSTDVATETSTDTATPTPASENDYTKEESQTNKEGLLPVHETSGSKSTVPNVALPSHCATNTVFPHTVGSVHSWSFKEVSLVAHAGQILWLAVLTGTVFYFLGATAQLWHVIYELRRTRV